MIEAYKAKAPPLNHLKSIFNVPHHLVYIPIVIKTRKAGLSRGVNNENSIYTHSNLRSCLSCEVKSPLSHPIGQIISSSGNGIILSSGPQKKISPTSMDVFELDHLISQK